MSATPRPETSGEAAPRVGEATRARFRRVDALLDAALDLDPAARAAFLDAATAGDPAVRAAVDALLAAEGRPDDFLDAGADPDALQARLQRALGDTYRIRRRLGRGGMAHVWLADDVRHGRSVAIKALAVDDDTDARGSAAHTVDVARFLDEVRTMARLQHPHLLPLIDSGDAEGVPFLVMPYVEGGTLRDRLVRDGMLPVAEAVRLARAIAGALAHAHAAGVVHRDLKPENVLLRDGEPLVADFGLALARTATRRTTPGLVVGTPQYMAPEQVAGDAPLDARTDVYALGAVLYESLAGEPPHVATTARGILVKVLTAVPVPLHALRPEVSPALSDVVARALATAPADRFESATAFAQALDGVRAAETRVQEATARPASRAAAARWRLVVGAAAVAALVGGAIAFARRSGAPTAAVARAARFVVQPVPEAAIGRAPTLTPDGRSIVYAGSAETARRLFVRPLTSLVARAVDGTRGALAVAVSPDGRSAAYVTEDDALMRVALDEGAPARIGDAFRYSTLAWAGPTHVVVAGWGTGGLTWRDATRTGVHPLTRIDGARRDASHAAPFVLPDARTVVFLVQREGAGPGGERAGRLALVTLDTLRTTPAPYTELDAVGGRPVAWLDGWLVWIGADRAQLLAQRLDTTTRRLVGRPVPVLQDAAGAIAVATLADDGTLLYTRQRPAAAPMWVDAAGRATAMPAVPTGRAMNPRLSPDGRRLALQVTHGDGDDAWVFDLATGGATRVTNTGGALNATWTPDGEYLVYFSPLGGRDALWRVAVDGRSPPERVLDASGLFAPEVARDGRTVVMQRNIGGTWSLWAATLLPPGRGATALRLLVGARASALMPALSPDGRWLAYVSNASGRYEVHLRAADGRGAEVQVSREGGTEPAWSADGTRLFFRGDRRLHVVDVAVRSGAVLPSVGAPRVRFVDTFDGDMPMPHRNYDVARDGRVVVMAGSPSGTAETVVVVGWREEARALLAAAPH